MGEVDQIRIEFVKDKAWEEEPIVGLYRAGGWWKEHMDKTKLQEVIRGSYLFAAAIDISTDWLVGMGRVISDGIADAYIQDVVVLPEWRNKGVGRMIVHSLLDCCRSRGIAWIGLIAQPGTIGFYRSQGFELMEGHFPMLFLER
jgi:GNAT superfamily N-acetyltransferase